MIHSRRARKELVYFIIGGLFLNQISYLLAIQATNSATATVLQSLQLLPVAVVSCVVGRRAPYPREMLGLTFALFGTFLISTGGSLSGIALPFAGLSFGLLSAAGGAGLSILPRRILKEYGVTAVMGWAMLVAGIIAGVFVCDWSQGIEQFSPSCWMVFFALVVLGTFCSYLLYMQGVREIGPLKAALLATSEPISATVLSMYWIGTVFSLTDIVGFVLIIVMMLLMAWHGAEST